MKEFILLIIFTSFSFAQVDRLQPFKEMEEEAKKIKEQVTSIKKNYYMISADPNSSTAYSGNIGVFNSHRINCAI